QGENGSGTAGLCNPTKPMNSAPSLASTAHKPQPFSVIRASQRSAIRSLSSRVRGAGKYFITLGSTLSRANGSRSDGRRCRSLRRVVLGSISSGIRVRQASVTPKEGLIYPPLLRQNTATEDLPDEAA